MPVANVLCCIACEVVEFVAKPYKHTIQCRYLYFKVGIMFMNAIKVLACCLAGVYLVLAFISSSTQNAIYVV